MNRGITSAPMNWAIDYGQNRAGEIMGNAIGNTGSMLGNTIMQYAKDKKAREETKAKEEAATRAILAGGYGKAAGLTDEKSIKQFVTANGADSAFNLIKISQDQQQIEQRGQQLEQTNRQLEQERRAAEAKAQAAEGERNAILAAVQASRQAPMPQAGRTYGPADEGAPTGTQGIEDVNMFIREAVKRGARPSDIKTIADSMTAAKKANKPPADVRYETAPDGSTIMISNGSAQNLGKPAQAREKKLEAGDEDDVKINGVTVKAVYLGGGNYVDKVTKAPLYVYRDDPSDPYVKIPRPNPLIFGVDAASSPPPSGGAPGQSTSASPATPAPSEDSYSDSASLIAAVRRGEVTTQQAREIAKKKGFK